LRERWIGARNIALALPDSKNPSIHHSITPIRRWSRGRDLPPRFLGVGQM
jgi:hypothetical protein